MRTQWPTIVALSGCLAIFSSWISTTLSPRFQHHDEAVYNQFAILKGIPHHIDGQEEEFSQFQGRVLFPLLLDGVTRMHLMSTSQSFTVLRLTTAFAAYLVFFLVCTEVQGVPIKIAVIGAGALAYALVFTFNHGWEHPTDFLDVAFFSGFVGLALRKRRALLALAVFVASLNHQTAAFAGVIWFFFWGVERRFKPKWWEAVYSGALVTGSYAVSTAVKFWFGGRSQPAGYVINGYLTISQFMDALRHPQPYAWPVLLLVMVLPVSLWLWSNRAVVRGDVSKLLWATLWIVVLSSPIAYWSELRSVFLAPVVIATLAATIAESRQATIAESRQAKSAGLPGLTEATS